MPSRFCSSSRDFLKVSAAVGGGFALELTVPALAQVSAAGKSRASAPELTAWIVIHPDDTVLIRIARSEMGQGSSTGLAMLVAEELGCDWSRVRTEFVSTGEQLPHTATGKLLKTKLRQDFKEYKLPGV